MERRWRNYEYGGITYSVSDDGVIVGARGKRLKTRINKDGYEEVSLGNIKNRNGRIKVHRLVAELFVDNPDCKPEVNHIDYDRQNNLFSNLEWVTHSENISYSVSAGHYIDSGELRAGESNGRSVLTSDDVVEIRKQLDLGVQATYLAKTYNVGNSTIYNIKAGNTWKHLG